MSSPYRGESESLRAELRANLHRITPALEALLPEVLRARVAEARTIVETPVPLAAHLDAARDAIAMAPEIDRRLNDLPNELPPLPDPSGEPVNEALLRACLPGRVTEVQVGEVGGAATFRCDGHPFVRRIFEAAWTHEPVVAMYTAVRSGVPAFELFAGPSPMLIRGATDAITKPVRDAARALGLVVAANVTVRSGLASVVWTGAIDSTRTHERAIRLLVALRDLRGPALVLLR